MDEEQIKTTEEVPENGAFNESLVRTAKQIRKDRADDITQDVETVYRRKVEDIGLKIRRMKAKLKSSLDFSPDSVHSLKPAEEVDAEIFASNDLDLIRQIRDQEIIYTLACKRYTYLFGKKISVEV